MRFNWLTFFGVFFLIGILTFWIVKYVAISSRWIVVIGLLWLSIYVFLGFKAVKEAEGN